MVPSAIYLYFMFLSNRLIKKYRRAAIVHENVTNCLGTACNNAKSIIKKPSNIYRFLIMSVLICNRDFFQLIILAEMSEISTKQKLAPVMFFVDNR